MKALLAALFVLGDLFVLKSGKTVEGVYVGEDDQSVRYRDASGQMHVEPKSEILRVDRAPTKTDLYEEIASAMTDEKPEDYYYLCAWAEEQGLRPSVKKLCKIGVSDEELRGKCFFRLGKVDTGDRARTRLGWAVVSDPTFVEAVGALEACAGEEVTLPAAFLVSFTKALKGAIEGKYSKALPPTKRALAELTGAQRRKVESVFKLQVGMTLDQYLSRLAALSKKGKSSFCSHCKGTGYLRCTKCGGQGWKNCSACSGKGHKQHRLYDPNLGTRTTIRGCSACKGKGRVDCRVCAPLSVPERQEYTLSVPSSRPEDVRLPGRQVTTADTPAPGSARDGRITRSPGTTWRVVGTVATFTRRYSGRRRCPHCLRTKKGGAAPFDLNELERLNRLAWAWEAEFRRLKGAWGQGIKMCGFEELHAKVRVEPEQSTAFYEGLWMTPRMRKMRQSVAGQKKVEVDTSQFEGWKSGYKCRMVAEHAVDIPADSRAWTSLLGLYLTTANSPAKRFASRQIFHATFRAGRGAASVISPDGSLLAVAEPELVLEPDKPVVAGGAGKVELWFRVLEARKGPKTVLAITVLAARQGSAPAVSFF